MDAELLRWEAENKEMMEKRRGEEAAKKEHKNVEEWRRVAAYREERESDGGESRCPQEGKVASLHLVVFITC